MAGAGQLAFLFTDIEGSTRLLASMGRAYDEALEEHRRVLREAVARAGGSPMGTEGDACFFSFPSAGRAIAAAVDAQARLDLPVRMAVHVGAVREVDGDYVGLPLHELARLLSAGHGGQILVSGAAADGVDGVSLVDHGEHWLRDVERPVRVYEVPGDRAFPPLRTLEGPPGNLPADTSRFVGRTRELADLHERLATHRLVTLTGVGGSGKTRLALEAARRIGGQHRDGAWWVDLSSVIDASYTTRAVAAALDVRDESVALDPVAAVTDHLSARQALVVLDNCEHVIDEAATVAIRILSACPSVTILATSREPLDVPGEVAWPVPGLAPDDADALFVTRAEEVRPGASAGDVGVRHLICEQLDGIPLAVELAAARLRTLSPSEVATRLADQLSFLTSGGRGRPPRQQTLAAALAWSHDTLAPDEQAMFRRLSVFAGGFTSDAVHHVTGVDALDALDQLTAKSLVVVDPGPRFRLLEPVRQFAAAKLADAGEDAATRAAHAAWAAHTAEAISLGIITEQARWTAVLRAEGPNLRAAMTWSFDGGNAAPGLAIVGSLGWAWFTAGDPDAVFWTGRAMEAVVDAPAALRQRVLLARGMALQNASDHDGSAAALTEAIEIARERNARGALAYALLWRGRNALFCARYEEANADLADALTLFRSRNDGLGIGWVLAFEAMSAWAAEDWGRVEECAAEAEAVGAATGIEHVALEGIRIRALVAAKWGDYERALPLAEDVLARRIAAGDRWQETVAANTLASIAWDAGERRRALELARHALRLSLEIQTNERVLGDLGLIAGFLVDLGRLDDAAYLAGAGERHLETSSTVARLTTSWIPEMPAAPEHEPARVEGRRLTLFDAARVALSWLDEAITTSATTTTS